MQIGDKVIVHWISKDGAAAEVRHGVITGVGQSKGAWVVKCDEVRSKLTVREDQLELVG